MHNIWIHDRVVGAGCWEGRGCDLGCVAVVVVVALLWHVQLRNRLGLELEK
jgi:hypothetical protein